MPFSGVKTKLISPKQSYNYQYPLKTKLKPGTKKHDKLVDFLLTQIEFSAVATQSKASDWQAVQNTLTAFIPPSTVNGVVDKIGSAPIVIPQSYASLQVLLTYQTQTLLEYPLFRYDGIGDSKEDMIGAAALTAIVQQQVQRDSMRLALHTHFRDAYSFGFGFSAAAWDSKRVKRTRTREVKKNVFGLFEQTEEETFTEDVLLYEGHKLYNVDPYSAILDPDVAINRIQDSAFVGWYNRTTYNALLMTEQNFDGEVFFNVRYLENLSNKTSVFYSGGRADRDQDQQTTAVSTTNEARTDVAFLYALIIPSDHGLSKTKTPQKWMFALAADSVIIDARPLDSDLDMYPVVVGAPDFDGYATLPTSRMEMLYGAQNFVDWLYTSHLANVRKALNDMFVVNTALIMQEDIENPKPGGFIRLRRQAIGVDPKMAVHQLNVRDVTGSHITDAANLMQVMQQTSAATETRQGNVVRSGERVSATEIAATEEAAMSRMQKDAIILGDMTMIPLGGILAEQTIQNMSEETQIKIAGDIFQKLKDRYGVETAVRTVSSLDLDIAYDLKVSTGAAPNMADTKAWVPMFQAIAASPELSAKYDIVSLFGHVAKGNGVTSPEDFRRVVNETEVQVRPDAEVAAQVQQGNLVPQG